MVKRKIKTTTVLLLCTALSVALVIAGIVCSFVCVKNFGTVRAAADASAAAGATLSTSIWAVVAILFALGGAVCVIYFINVKTIVKPTLMMEKHFARIAHGDLHTACPLSEDTSEIGQLVTSANLMQKNFNHYIDSIEAVLRALAAGDLAVKTDQDFAGDFVRIRDALEQITASFGDSFAEINVAAQEVSSGAEQISSGATSLSEGSSEQAATIEELVSTMTEVSQRVADTVQNAEQVRAAAARMMDVIRGGTESLSLLASQIENTGTYSADIGKIVKVIDGVAFQTNILALNAAVEAARAGESGAAFSVVADEIRALSNQTAQNAKAITALIDEMLKSLSAGVGTAKTTEGSLEAIIGSAENVQKLVSRITETMESDSAAVEESLASLEQLSAVVQTGSATAEESAATSEEIAVQAIAVRELVGRFKR